MKIVGFFEETAAIEKILRHGNLWKESPRPPPVQTTGPLLPEGLTLDDALLSLPFLKRKVYGAPHHYVIPLSARTAYDTCRFFSLELETAGPVF